MMTMIMKMIMMIIMATIMIFMNIHEGRAQFASQLVDLAAGFRWRPLGASRPLSLVARRPSWWLLAGLSLAGQQQHWWWPSNLVSANVEPLAVWLAVWLTGCTATHRRRHFIQIHFARPPFC